MTDEPKALPAGRQGQRKLVAIMFTDMVGYSALTQKNEALALALLDVQKKTLRQIFPRHHGKEIDTAGDSFFVEFASALEAARCAIEIQKTLWTYNSPLPKEKQIIIRIGLHLGDVVKKGKNLHGDGVNIAARIEPLAPPGGVCVSEDIARQIENKIDTPLVRIGKGELKNIQLPVNIFRVVLPWEKKQGALSHRLDFALKKKRVRLIGVTAVVALAAMSAYVFFSPPSVSADSRSIAVLPFTNMSGEAENEYFSDGITEGIIISLSQIKDLKVISPGSVMTQFKRREKSRRDIAKELNVANILEGSVYRSGNQVRIGAQLVEAASDRQLWGRNYDRELTQIFAIQSEVSQRIARELQARLSPGDAERLNKRPTDDLDAYTLVLKGRYSLNKRMPDDLKKSIGFFQQAIDKDSTYALAYANLADAYTLLGNLDMLSPARAYGAAKVATEKALELDSLLAEAHTSLAFVKMHYDRDWPGAESEFKRAIELNPSYATAYSWYGLYLVVLGRFAEADEVMRRALSLDPLSTVIAADAGLLLYFGRHYERTIDHFKKILENNSTFVAAYIPLGGAYIQKHMYREGVDALQQASLFSHHPVVSAALGNCYAVSGRTEEAQNTLDALMNRRNDGEYIPPYWIAVVHAGLGETDSVFAWLGRAYDEHDGSLVYLNVMPAFDSFHSDPRFASLLKKMHLDRQKL
jgi:TolB-like protein/class 3 adenylate cyclase